MRNFLTAVMTASLCSASTLMPVHAETELQHCNASHAKAFIGEHLTRTLKEQVRVAAHAKHVVVNPTHQDFEPNRLRITTDHNLMITRLECH